MPRDTALTAGQASADARHAFMPRPNTHPLQAEQSQAVEPWFPQGMLGRQHSASQLRTIVPVENSFQFEPLDQGLAPPGWRRVQLGLTKLSIAQPAQHALPSTLSSTAGAGRAERRRVGGAQAGGTGGGAQPHPVWGTRPLWTVLYPSVLFYSPKCTGLSPLLSPREVSLFD